MGPTQEKAAKEAGQRQAYYLPKLSIDKCRTTRPTVYCHYYYVTRGPEP